MTISITGWGLATPLGLSAPETWQNLLAGRAILNHSRVPIILPPNRTRVNHLALIAAREALARSHWTNDEIQCDFTALVIGTSKGPIEDWLTGEKPNSPTINNGSDLRAGYGLSQTSTALSSDLGLGMGPRLILSAACASGLHALIRAVLMLKSGQVKRALVVAVESSLHPLFLGCFQRLGVLAEPEIGCKPFDEHRDGFHMSEAAAAVCLEAANDPDDLFSRVSIERFAMGGTAGHLTAGEADGAVLCHLLSRVIDDRPVDLIHAHGTGTQVNDAVELSAIEWALGNRQQSELPILYSHKGALGHSLGAAGLVAVVLNCLMHTSDVVPPNVKTTTPLPMRQVTLSQQLIQRPIRRSIAAATGFGGPTAVVSIVKN